VFDAGPIYFLKQNKRSDMTGSEMGRFFISMFEAEAKERLRGAGEKGPPQRRVWWRASENIPKHLNNDTEIRNKLGLLLIA
jgi:hypothetical protein